jgi:hypothetical protein
MENDDSQDELGVPFAGEYLERYTANLRRMPAVKDWRTI